MIRSHRHYDRAAWDTCTECHDQTARARVAAVVELAAAAGLGSAYTRMTTEGEVNAWLARPA